MKIFTKINELEKYIIALKKSGKYIGFIPTMGALHEGHVSLIKKSKEENDITIVSIFVNPLQFNNGTDLDTYPRTLTEDSKRIELFTDILFAPLVEEMYPEPVQISVKVGKIGEELEGEFRPGHFEGMATVVLKLFHICQPTKAYFGQKDYQQVLVVRKMISDLNFPIELVMMPTIREESGLAMSSRNRRLTENQKNTAVIISSVLKEAQDKAKEGNISPSKIEEYVHNQIMQEASIKVEYVAVRSATDLSNIENFQEDAVILIAAYIGDVRLIDNCIIKKNLFG